MSLQRMPDQQLEGCGVLLLQLCSHHTVRPSACLGSETSSNRTRCGCRDRARVRETCDPPFGERPDCFSFTALGMLTSTACAESYARLYNVSDVTILVNIANTVAAIQAACTGVATEVRQRSLSPCDTAKPVAQRCALYSVPYIPTAHALYTVAVLSVKPPGGGADSSVQQPRMRTPVMHTWQRNNPKVLHPTWWLCCATSAWDMRCGAVRSCESHSM